MFQSHSYIADSGQSLCREARLGTVVCGAALSVLTCSSISALLARSYEISDKGIHKLFLKSSPRLQGDSEKCSRGQGPLQWQCYHTEHREQ